jgi:hypothetical protein
MRQRLTKYALALTLLIAVLAGVAASAAPSSRFLPTPPAEFFGMAPQTPLTERDAEYMRAGGVGAVRIPVPWVLVQPTRAHVYSWGWLDPIVAAAARSGLRVLPFLYGTPPWLAPQPTTLPVGSERARQAWGAFLASAVERYGPRGTFWSEHGTVGPGPDYEPPIARLPIRTWQIWNEANFFYFAKPVSPSSYAKLVTISSHAIKTFDPGAKLILSGLFAKPTAAMPRGMPAAQFLAALYRTPGIKSRFDGVALHPYAVDTESLEEFVEAFHDVTVENHDRVPLYVTEMGWGSQNDFNQVAFEQGIQGQTRQLRDAYGYLLENRARLDLKQVFWFSWKDNREIAECNFCDSTGLFREGRGFKPKPAWKAFVRIAHGRPKP